MTTPASPQSTQRRRRQDYAPTVRPRSMPPGGGVDTSNFEAYDVKPNGVQSVAGTIAAATTTPVTIKDPGAGQRLRLVRIRCYVDTSDVDTIEAYWGSAATMPGGANAQGVVFREPTNSAYTSIISESWGPGRGPVGTPAEVFSMRRGTAPAGQTLYWVLWYTLEP